MACPMPSAGTWLTWGWTPIRSPLGFRQALSFCAIFSLMTAWGDRVLPGIDGLGRWWLWLSAFRMESSGGAGQWRSGEAQAEPVPLSDFLGTRQPDSLPLGQLAPPEVRVGEERQFQGIPGLRACLLISREPSPGQGRVSGLGMFWLPSSDQTVLLSAVTGEPEPWPFSTSWD